MPEGLFMKRRTLVQFAAALLMSTAIGPAFAATHKPFDLQAFEQAQAAGLPILVHVTAPWCPTCKAQKPVIEDLAKSSDFNKLVIFDVDFDSQTDTLRLFNAQSQSTLIAFRGKAETSRSVGETDPAAIATVMKSAIGP
jgi:thioredoxin 1